MLQPSKHFAFQGQLIPQLTAIHNAKLRSQCAHATTLRRSHSPARKTRRGKCYVFNIMWHYESGCGSCTLLAHSLPGRLHSDVHSNGIFYPLLLSSRLFAFIIPMHPATLTRMSFGGSVAANLSPGLLGSRLR